MRVTYKVSSDFEGAHISHHTKAAKPEKYKGMMVRSQGNNQIAKRNDTLDQLFEWAETVMCPTSMRNFASEPKEDTLDYVFEHVVSQLPFTY